MLKNIKPKKYILDIVKYYKKYLIPKKFEVLKFYFKAYFIKNL